MNWSLPQSRLVLFFFLRKQLGYERKRKEQNTKQEKEKEQNQNLQHKTEMRTKLV
jgi:hypothetical protein